MARKGRIKGTKNKISKSRIKYPVIYAIINNINGKMYIGSSKDFVKRSWEHFNALKLNKHVSKYLQRSYNKYGKENFSIEIIENINNLEDLIKREQCWLDFLKPEYNTLPIAYSHLGAKRSAESKKRMSLAQVKNIIYQYDKDMNLIKIHTEGRNVAAKETNIKSSALSMCLSGKNKTCGGFKWLQIKKGVKL
jgi:group I intron endonuclease